MSSIGQKDRQVKADNVCCDWYRGREEHHNQWLAQLQNRTPAATVWFHRELEAERDVPFVDPARNIFVDIEDIAEAHREQLPSCGLRLARTLAFWASSAFFLRQLPEMEALILVPDEGVKLCA